MLWEKRTQNNLGMTEDISKRIIVSNNCQYIGKEENSKEPKKGKTSLMP